MSSDAALTSIALEFQLRDFPTATVVGVHPGHGGWAAVLVEPEGPLRIDPDAVSAAVDQLAAAQFTPCWRLFAR